MLVEALLVSLIVSISFFLFEFFKMRSIFENTFRYNQFFSGFGLSKFKLFDTVEKRENEIKTEFSNVERRFYGIEDRLSKQENFMERLIKEISGVNG